MTSLGFDNDILVCEYMAMNDMHEFGLPLVSRNVITRGLEGGALRHLGNFAVEPWGNETRGEVQRRFDDIRTAYEPGNAVIGAALNEGGVPGGISDYRGVYVNAPQ